MTPTGRIGGGAFILVLAAASVHPVCAMAQADTTRPSQPPPQRPPSDSARVDSLRRDSVRVDSPRVFVPTFPRPATPGPSAWGARQVFDADSLRFSGAMTLADLLARVPGTFVARGGFFGQAEPVFYGGRGSSGIEVYWDGVPFRPLGRDSVFLDLGRIPLAPLERVEVLRLPDRLRVDVFTARPDDTEPRTGIGITTGDLNIADYRASFARRWRSGVGISLLADFNSLDGDAATTTKFSANDLWLKAEWIPRPTFGASYQILRSNWDRDPRGTRVDRWKASRYDGMLRAFVGSRSDGLGWRLQGSLTSSEVSGDTALIGRHRKDGVTRGALEASYRTSRAAVSAVGRMANDVRPREAEAHADWLVLPWLNLSASARYAGYSGDRTETRVAGGGAMRLPLGFSARGEVVRSAQLDAPRILTDTVQHMVDWLGAIRWDSRWAAIEVSRSEREPFRPIGFPKGLRSIAELGPTPRTTEVTVHGTVRPLPGLELSGWYSDPIEGGGDFQLPHHSRYSVTFFSKFWRVYRSGVFALRAEVAAESWSRGLGGVARDTAGNTSQLFRSGATFLDLNLEIQVVGVTIFWQMRNANGMRNGYVNGLDYPHIVQFYGARWTFLN